MDTNSNLLLKTLQGEKTSRPPFWFMRQAGRYLPEYKELRSKAKNFLDFCYNPILASEATLQPIRRFGMDGAIIFSDILVIPDALGVNVRFEEGKGPILEPIQKEESLEKLHFDVDKLAPVYEALKKVKLDLLKETALIGFAGAPWTLACYIVHGSSDKDFAQVRSLALLQKRFFSDLISLLTTSVIQHAINQIKAGADIIQLFDSWAGVLNEQEFTEWVITPTQKIVEGIRQEFPNVPIIGFPRLAGSKYLDYFSKTKVQAINIDHSVSLEWSKQELQKKGIVQGNLDPVTLATDKNAMLAQAKHIVSTLGDKPFVFNLGHGILPHTPIGHVEALSDFLKNGA